MTFHKYADSELAEDNFVVRAVVYNMEGKLSTSDLKLAKDIFKINK